MPTLARRSVTPRGRGLAYTVLPPVRLAALDLPVSALMFLVPGVTAAILVGRAGGWAAVGALLRRAVTTTPAGWRSRAGLP